MAFRNRAEPWMAEPERTGTYLQRVSEGHHHSQRPTRSLVSLRIKRDKITAGYFIRYMSKSDELGIEAIDGRCYAVDVVSNPAVSGVVLVAFVPQHQQCEWLVVER